MDRLFKTNYVKGLKHRTENYKTTQDYFENKINLLNIATVGSGIVYGYLDSLKVTIEGNMIVLKSGMAIDNKGNVIYVPNVQTIRQDKQIGNFNDKCTIYISIKYLETLSDFHRFEEQEVAYEIDSRFELNVSTSKPVDEYVLLATIDIDFNTSNEIINAKNPFNPKRNEINLLNNKYIYSQSVLNKTTTENISDVFERLGNFLQELSFRKKIISSATASALAYTLSQELINNRLSVKQIYTNIYKLTQTILFIEKENEKVKNSIFWRNILHIKQIFDENIHQYDFFTINLQNHHDVFAKIIFHTNNAIKINGEWDNIFQSEKEEEENDEYEDNKNEKKEYILIGRGSANDILFNAVDVSRSHLRVTYNDGFFVEDLGSTVGTFINSEKLLPNVKQLVTTKDKIELGKMGSFVNLNHELLQGLM